MSKTKNYRVILLMMSCVMALVSGCGNTPAETVEASSFTEETTETATPAGNTTEDATESEKTTETATKAEKTTAAATKAEKTTAAATKAEKTTAAATKAEKTTAAATKAEKTTKAAEEYVFPRGIWQGTLQTLIRFSEPKNGAGSVSYRERTWDSAVSGDYTVDNGLLTVHIPGSNGKPYVLTADISSEKHFTLDCSNGQEWTPEDFTRTLDCGDFMLSNESASVVLSIGDSVQLSYEITGDTSMNDQVSFISEDSSVASVDDTGKITAENIGGTRILCDCGEQRVSWDIKVEGIIPDGRYIIPNVFLSTLYENPNDINQGLTFKANELVISSDLYMDDEAHTDRNNIGHVSLSISESCTIYDSGSTDEDRSYNGAYSSWYTTKGQYGHAEGNGEMKASVYVLTKLHIENGQVTFIRIDAL